MPTPGWLRGYWSEQLSPALQDWELAGGPPTQLQVLFDQMLVDWSQMRRKPLSEYTVATYVTQTREWLSTLPLRDTNSVLNPETGQRQHVALTYFNFPAIYWAELTLRSREKLQERTLQLLSLPDPSGIIARGRALLQHEDWAVLAAGIITMVGRRVGEVLLSGEIVPKSDYSLLFSGRLKLRGKPDVTFEIPTLCEASLVLSAWERLRTHPDLLAMQLPLGERTRGNLDRINGRLYPKVRAAVTHFFAELVPSVEEEEEKLFSHLFRALYGTLAVWRYCPTWVDPDTFMAKILGHSYLSRIQGQERLNYLSQHFYHRFVILAPDGRLDGRRGIALGEPGVQLLEGIPQQEKPMNQQKENLGTIKPQGKKRRKKSARDSKTGFTLVKPRNASGKRFDQIAKDHDLYWKDDDDTFVLLLDTYDAHQQCLQQPSRTFVPTQLSPEDLGLPPALVALVREAMQQSEQDVFRDFLQDALKRESKTQIGLAKVKKEREQERPDFSQVPTSELLKTRRQPEAYERIRRAIATIIEHNRRSSDPNERWYISQTLLREFTGAHPRFIKPVLDANTELLERHHQHFGILSAHNRTPAPKLEPIAKMLRIVEHPADLPVLDEIVLPAFDGSAESEEPAASSS